jgi:hypothetical protein
MRPSPTACRAAQSLAARLADLVQEIFPRDQQAPEALCAYQKAEIDKWWSIIKEFGIKPASPNGP